MQEKDLLALGGGLLAFACLLIAVGLVILVCYLLTLQTALSRVSPRNRLMEPGSVWLMLIPCVNFIWQFVIAVRVPDSLRNEFRDRGRDDGSDYGKSLALTQCVLGIVNIFIGNILGRVPEFAVMANLIAGVIGIVGLVIFIVFWVKIAGYSSQLAMDDRGDLDRKLDQFDDDDGYGTGKSGGGSDVPPGGFKPGDPGYKPGDPSH
jgi:hypothetical protein